MTLLTLTKSPLQHFTSEFALKLPPQLLGFVPSLELAGDGLFPNDKGEQVKTSFLAFDQSSTILFSSISQTVLLGLGLRKLLMGASVGRGWSIKIRILWVKAYLYYRTLKLHYASFCWASVRGDHSLQLFPSFCFCFFLTIHLFVCVHTFCETLEFQETQFGDSKKSSGSFSSDFQIMGGLNARVV